MFRGKDDVLTFTKWLSRFNTSTSNRIALRFIRQNLQRWVGYVWFGRPVRSRITGEKLLVRPTCTQDIKMYRREIDWMDAFSWTRWWTCGFHKRQEKYWVLRCKTKINSVALVRKRTIPTERPPLVEKLVPTFADRGRRVVSATDPHGR
jgi:hypothetical protein